MYAFDIFYYCADFTFHGRIYHVGIILSYHGFVGRNFQNVKPVNGLEFFFFGLSRSRHTRKLVVKTEIILECNGRLSLVFVSDNNLFFCFDCLMQPVGISSSDHQSAGEFVNDYNFVILHDIVVVALKDKMRF